MPSAVLASKLEVSGLPPYARDQLKALCTWRRRGRLQPRTPRAFRLWGELQDGTLLLPRAVLPAVRQLVPGLHPRDERLLLPAQSFGWSRTLFDYQHRAVTRLLGQGGGVLISPGGSGKTEMALAFAAQARQPFLWLVHDQGLALQALRRAQSVFNLGEDAFGRIWEGQRSIGTHGTFCCIQTLVKYRYQIENRFGCVIVDEVHHSGAPTVAEVISRFPAAWRLGMTATTERGDGLEPAIYALFGAPVRVTHQELVAAGRYLVPALQFHYYRGLNPPTDDWHGIQTARMRELRRNWGVCQIARRAAMSGRRVLLLVDWKSHARYLVQMLGQLRVPSAYIVGEVDVARRELLVRVLERWAGRVLVATRLADEGLDVPSLDCLILATPGRSPLRLIQQVARAQRIVPGKVSAEIHDIVDTDIPSLEHQWEIRKGVYRDLGILGGVSVA